MIVKEKKPRTRSDMVVNEMLSIIRSGEFGFNSKLPSETVLAEKFGVSRSTLREAFKKLEQLGAVTIRQGSGTFVAGHDEIDNMETEETRMKSIIKEAFHLKSYQVTQYLDARKMVELKALELAIDRMDDSNYYALQEIVEKSEREDCTVSEYYELDCMFHREIIKSAKNEFLQSFWEVLEPCLREQQTRLNRPEEWLIGSKAAHRSIYEALLARNKKMAQELMTNHLGLILGRFFIGVADSMRKH